MNIISRSVRVNSMKRYFSSAVTRDLRSCTVQKLVDRLGSDRVLHQISQDKLLSQALDEMRKEDVDALLVLKATSPVGKYDKLARTFCLQTRAEFSISQQFWCSLSFPTQACCHSQTLLVMHVPIMES